MLTIGRGSSSDIRWEPDSGKFDATLLEGIEAVVNLVGAPIDVRWTAGKKRDIRNSRVRSTALLSAAIASLSVKPSVLVNGSAVGFYGSRGDDILTEASGGGDGFLSGVVREWEAATTPAREAGIRVVNMRTGVVLARHGGMLKRLLFPFRLGLGGPIAGGEHWLSWIALHDHVRAIRFAFTSQLSGPVNFVSPRPVTNGEFTRALGRVLQKPTMIPLPAFALRAGFGQMAEETILASQRAVPATLQAASFSFDAPEIDTALRRELTSGTE